MAAATDDTYMTPALSADAHELYDNVAPPPPDSDDEVAAAPPPRPNKGGIAPGRPTSVKPGASNPPRPSKPPSFRAAAKPEAVDVEDEEFDGFGDDAYGFGDIEMPPPMVPTPDSAPARPAKRSSVKITGLCEDSTSDSPTKSISLAVESGSSTDVVSEDMSSSMRRPVPTPRQAVPDRPPKSSPGNGVLEDVSLLRKDSVIVAPSPSSSHLEEVVFTREEPPEVQHPEDVIIVGGENSASGGYENVQQVLYENTTPLGTVKPPEPASPPKPKKKSVGFAIEEEPQADIQVEHKSEDFFIDSAGVKRRQYENQVLHNALEAGADADQAELILDNLLESECIYMNARPDAEAIVDSLLDEDLYINMPEKKAPPPNADAETEDLYMNYGNIADQLMSLREEEEEAVVTPVLDETYTSLKELRSHITNLGVDLNEQSEGAKPDAKKNGKLGFSTGSPVWELLRCTAFMCLNAEFEKATCLLERGAPGDFCFQKPVKGRKTINFLINVGDDKVEVYEVKRLRKAYLIFDSEYETLIDLVEDLKKYGDEDIPVTLQHCCSGLDFMIEKVLKKFFNNPEITQETFSLKKLILTLCSGMRDKFGKAAAIPFMPEVLERAFLPSVKQELSLGPTFQVADVRAAEKKVPMSVAAKSMTLPTNMKVGGAGLMAAPDSDDEDEKPKPKKAVNFNRAASAGSVKIKDRAPAPLGGAGASSTLPVGFSLAAAMADSNPLGMDRNTLMDNNDKTATLPTRPPAAKSGYLQIRKLSKSFFKSTKRVWEKRWFELQGTELVCRETGSFVYKPVVDVGSGTAVELEGAKKEVIAVTTVHGRIHRLQAESPSEAKAWVKALKQARKSSAQAVFQNRDCLAVVVVKEADGLGVELDFNQKGVVLVSAIRPDRAQALRVGDIVLEIDDESLHGRKAEDIVRKLSDLPVGQVNFKVTRERSEHAIDSVPEEQEY